MIERLNDACEEAELFADWQYEVTQGDTLLGYFEWLEHVKEANGSP